MARVRWSVYVLASEAATRTYVGIACDVEARLRQHNGEAKGGAKSTRGFRPWRVAGVFGPYLSRGKAQRIEAAIKRLRGDARLDLDGLRSTVRRAARPR
ncbi:MAG TPA: GIY-YIG nuclease family protein [Nannocystaceae bacterium]|nr:GIY-YIG nuclease family protein [Nannocystaceae bacterium]